MKSAQGPRLKNAETHKNDESNKFDKNYKKSLLEARMRGHVETDVTKI